MSEEKKKKIFYKLNTDYKDFGPTFACEKLWERDGIKVSKETVRQMMIKAELFEIKTKQVDDTHQMQERRE